MMHEPMPWGAERAQRWYRSNTVRADAVPSLERVVAAKRAAGSRVSVVLPALNEAPTIGAICRTIERHLVRAGLVDELLVVDGGSADDTAAIARANGARVVAVGTLIPEVPPAGGKGDSLWRSLAGTDGDIVAWIDADIRRFDPRFLTRLVWPLVDDERIAFVKGFYRRPLVLGGARVEDAGGRVTELLARPLLAAFFPELGGFVQPLSGEYAGRREALERLPFFTGYGVEVGLLIDLLQTAGLDALAQVDLDVRVHRNRPLAELGPMAYAIAQTILRRAEEAGRLRAGVDYPTHPLLVPMQDEMVIRHPTQVERPPIELLPSYVSALAGPAAAAVR